MNSKPESESFGRELGLRILRFMIRDKTINSAKRFILLYSETHWKMDKPQTILINFSMSQKTICNLRWKSYDDTTKLTLRFLCLSIYGLLKFVCCSSLIAGREERNWQTSQIIPISSDAFQNDRIPNFWDKKGPISVALNYDSFCHGLLWMEKR